MWASLRGVPYFFCANKIANKCVQTPINLSNSIENISIH